MTNAQLYLAYIIRTVLVLIGILMNPSDNQALRAEMMALRGEMISLRNQIHADMVCAA